jgi:Arc/MetJ-type ribon-helix-helix transcriptional regulator
LWGDIPVRKYNKIKGRSRKRPRPAHKAPQCGAFSRFPKRSLFQHISEKAQSGIQKGTVFPALAPLLTDGKERRTPMEEKVKKKTTFWLPPDMIDRMDSWLKADNCRSRNEFVEKALRFYMGYLGTEDNTAYISQAILTAIQGTLDDNNNRLRTILFKCAVELNMLCHTIAAHFRTDPIHTRELRAYAVDEVKRTNGQVSFESAVRSQRRIEPDDAWPGSY